MSGRAYIRTMTVEAVCEVRLYAAAEEGGAFLDFQVKGAAEA